MLTKNKLLHQYHRSCSQGSPHQRKKKRYLNHTQAFNACTRMEIVKNSTKPAHQKLEFFTPYHCKFCGGWHIGHGRGGD